MSEPERLPRRRSSRLIDRVTDVLGHEVTFVGIVVLDLLVLMLMDELTRVSAARTS